RVPLARRDPPPEPPPPARAPAAPQPGTNTPKTTHAANARFIASRRITPGRPRQPQAASTRRERGATLSHAAGSRPRPRVDPPRPRRLRRATQPLRADPEARRTRHPAG